MESLLTNWVPDSRLLQLSILVLAYVIVKSVATVVYNVWFHPLAKIPGPKIAGAMYLYQTYYSLIGGSRYYIEIGKIHEKYGPIIRITPDEVHFSDPENYEKIYFVGSKHPKSIFYSRFSINYSTFTALSPSVHRLRRSALNPFFSRTKVLALESIIQEKASLLTSLIQDAFKDGKELNLHWLFRSISVDVITEYAFGDCYNLMKSPDLGEAFLGILPEIGPTTWLFTQFPALQRILLSLPENVTSFLSPVMGQFFLFLNRCRQICVQVKEAMESGRNEGRQLIFQELFSTEGKEDDYVVPTSDQLTDEAYSFLGAASDTTGSALTTATYHTITNPEIYASVRKELEAEFPDPNERLDFVRLESLPYLSAIIKEGLRLSFGVPGRLPREVPAGGQMFHGFFIPAGSIISMSSWDLHRNPSYFPSPLTFNPSRWLDPSSVRHMEKAFVPFSKGSRGCVGITLAHSELYITLGTLFRQFGNLKANVLTEEDWVKDDYFSGIAPSSAWKFCVSAA